MKIAIIGSRDFNDYDKMVRILDQFPISHIISGGAKGADSLVQEYAKERGIPITIYYPNWDFHGRTAGKKRNILIIGEAEEIIAFWDGKSPGTKHALTLAKNVGKKYHLCLYKEEKNG